MAELEMLIANDPGVYEMLQEQALQALEDVKDQGYDFDGLSEWLSQQADFEDWKDQAWDYAEMFAQNIPDDQIASYVFNWNEDEEAGRYMAAKYKELLEGMLWADPQQMYEWGHPGQPRDEWGGELDIPARPFWWMDNPDAQVATVEKMIEMSLDKQNRPARENLSRAQHDAARGHALSIRSAVARRRPDSKAAGYWEGVAAAHDYAGAGELWPGAREEGRIKRNLGIENYSKREHEELADRYRTAEAAYQTAGQLQAQMGNDHLSEVYYDQAPGLGGQQRAHFQASVRPYRVALDKADAVVKRAGEDLESTIQTRMSQRNPPAQWVEKRQADWEIHPNTEPGGLREYGIVFRYAPQSKTTTGGRSRRLKTSYAGQLKKKVPAGTKYIAVIAYYGAAAMKILGAYKTLGPAKKRVEKELGASSNPPLPQVDKWIHHTLGLHRGQYIRAAGRPVALQLVTPYTPRSGAPGTREDAKHWGGIYEQEQGRKVPKGTKYLLIDHNLGKTTAHKTVKAAKAAADKSLGLSPKRNKPKSSRSSSYAVQVRKSKGAKPTKVKLPKSAGAHRVNGKIVHRAVSYAGGKLKLLKGWTVSTLAGLGIARFKTKAAAVRHAKK